MNEPDPALEPLLEAIAPKLDGLPKRDREIITSELKRIFRDEGEAPMSTIPDELLDTLDFLVHRYHLHSRLPVDLTSVLEKFEQHKYTSPPLLWASCWCGPSRYTLD